MRIHYHTVDWQTRPPSDLGQLFRCLVYPCIDHCSVCITRGRVLISGRREGMGIADLSRVSESIFARNTFALVKSFDIELLTL